MEQVMLTQSMLRKYEMYLTTIMLLFRPQNGKVDQGGGGTIAYVMANKAMSVIDSGVAVLSMHAPYEVTSKSDIYEVYRGYKAFLKDMK